MAEEILLTLAQADPEAEDTELLLMVAQAQINSVAAVEEDPVLLLEVLEETVSFSFED